jgi:hypothetical protein
MTRHRPIVIVTAPTGATYQPGRYPYLPVTPAQAVADAEACFRAGAGMFHWHARNEASGEQFADSAWYQQVVRSVRRKLGLVPQSCATSRKGEVSRQIEDSLEKAGSCSLARRIDLEMIRACGLAAQPDAMTSFSAGELAIFGGDHTADQTGYSALQAWRDPKIVQAYYLRLRSELAARGIVEEFEITTSASFSILGRLACDSSLGVGPSLHCVVLLGFSAKLPISWTAYSMAMAQLEEFSRRTGIEPAITVGAVIPPHAAVTDPAKREEEIAAGRKDYQQVMEWVAEDDRVDGFRVGMEDTVELYGERVSNAGLVAHAVQYFRRRGIRVENSAEFVRARFGFGRAALAAAA